VQPHPDESAGGIRQHVADVVEGDVAAVAGMVVGRAIHHAGGQGSGRAHGRILPARAGPIKRATGAANSGTGRNAVAAVARSSGHCAAEHAAATAAGRPVPPAPPPRPAG
ncbi:hypothetical protein COK69_26775, partial [Bacillus cereus]